MKGISLSYFFKPERLDKKKKNKDNIIAAVEIGKWFNKAFSVPSHSMKLSQHLALQNRLITREWFIPFDCQQSNIQPQQ